MTASNAEGRLGVQCSCGEFNAFPGYVYAHAYEELTFTCNCGLQYSIRHLEFTLMEETKSGK